MGSSFVKSMRSNSRSLTPMVPHPQVLIGLSNPPWKFCGSPMYTSQWRQHCECSNFWIQYDMSTADFIIGSLGKISGSLGTFRFFPPCRLYALSNGPFNSEAALDMVGRDGNGNATAGPSNESPQKGGPKGWKLVAPARKTIGGKPPIKTGGRKRKQSDDGEAMDPPTSPPAKWQLKPASAASEQAGPV